MKSAIVDTSFLINMHILGLLDILCNIYDTIFITSTVWDESAELHPFLLKLQCLKQIILTDEELRAEKELHEEFTAKYKGVHHGEIEALIVASFRNIPLVLCDNFAPWYLQRTRGGSLSEPQIARGHSAVERMLSKGLINPTFIDNLEGTYPKKAINKLRRRFLNE